MHYDIVIVGGGAGGLELAARLGRALGPRQGRERVLLVDRFAFHIWKPMPNCWRAWAAASVFGWT